MRRVLGIALTIIAVTGALAALLALVLYRASQHEPEFYQRALRVEPARQKQSGDELEQSVLHLHNQAREEGRWQALFTDEQINGWLAVDLPEKFSNVLPPGVQDPRVAIDPEFARVACRYEKGKVKTVVSFSLDIHLTDETNTLAVRISKVRAGTLPLPLKQWLDRITAYAEKGDIHLRWSQTDGDPVALVTVPIQHEDYAHREIYLETIELRRGEVFLAGRTQRAAAAAGQTVAQLGTVNQPGENSTAHR